MHNYLRILVFVALAACTQNDGAMQTTRSADAGVDIYEDDAATCNPITCEDVGNSCGALSDLCSGILEGCNGCGAPQTCGGGGVANECGTGGCTKESDVELCIDAEVSCGAITRTDGCGEIRTVISCGVCTGSMICGGAGDAGVCGEPAPRYWQGWKLSTDYADYILAVEPLESGFLTALKSHVDPNPVFTVSRRDGDGEVLWSTSVVGPGSEQQRKLKPLALKAETDGGSYFLAQSPGPLQVGNVTGESGLQLVRLSAAGTMLWMRTLPQYAKNGFLALQPGGGVCYANHGEYNPVLHSLSLGCFDAAGNEQWSKYYGKTEPLSFGVDDAGNAYLAGEYSSQSPLSDGGSDYFIMSFDSDGEQRWFQRGHGGGALKSDGTFLLAYSSPDDTIKILKLSSSGDLQWLDNTLQVEVATNLRVAWSGDDFYLKLSYRGDFKIGDQTLSSDSYLDDDGMLVRFASDGEALWARSSSEVFGHICVREQTGDVWLTNTVVASPDTFITGFAPDGSFLLHEEALSGGNVGMHAIDCSDEYLYFKGRADFGGSVGPEGPALQPSYPQGGIVGRRSWPQ